MQYLTNAAAKEGLPFHPPTKAYRTRLAQEMGKWAESQDRGDEFHQAIFHAYFVKSQNISAPSTLITIAKALGLSAAEAEKIITHRTYGQEVDEDWSLAKEMNITAVPTLLLNQNRLVGAQSNEAFSYFFVNNLLSEP